MSKIINPKADYIAIENFSLNDYHIVLNGSDTFVKSVEFKKDDEISTSSQSGSLGDIWKITNLRTNETAKFWSYDYGLPKELKNKVLKPSEIKVEENDNSDDYLEWELIHTEDGIDNNWSINDIEGLKNQEINDFRISIKDHYYNEDDHYIVFQPEDVKQYFSKLTGELTTD